MGWCLARSAACAAILYAMTPCFTSSRFGSPMLLGRDVAEQRGPQLGNARRTDGGSDVVVARRDVRCQRPERVEGCLLAPLDLLGHVIRNLIHGNVPRPFIHDLNVLFPRALLQLSLNCQFAELGEVVG